MTIVMCDRCGVDKYISIVIDTNTFEINKFDMVQPRKYYRDLCENCYKDFMRFLRYDSKIL